MAAMRKCDNCGEPVREPANFRFCPRCGEMLVQSGAKYKTKKALQSACSAYFMKCDVQGTLYSEPGLALALGVTRDTLRNWRTGKNAPEFRQVILNAYLRIAEQIETDPRYQEKGGMTSRAIFLLKQPQFGGYQDRIEAKQELAVKVSMGENADESDFK